ncbi:tyrosine-type recombinase/integrase [bacterium]|nr:tyrosine-type recombinase/integrase [bacterium]
MARVFQRKPGGIFYLDYTYNGRRIKESAGTRSRREAEKCLHSRMGDIVQGKFNLESRKPAPTLFEFSEQYVEWARQNKKHSSWVRDENSLKRLLPVFGTERLTKINPFMVERYKIDRKARVQPATINREVSLLKRMLNLAVEWDIISKNPIKKVKKLKEPAGPVRFLEAREMRKLIDACEPPFQWIVITALNTGMRKMEVVNLTWPQVDLARGLITLTATKNGETRHLPINRTLQTMFQEIPRVSNFVFAKKDGNPYVNINKAWTVAREKSGVWCRFHDLRHTFASHLVMNGVDLMTVKALLGHKTLAMVQRYAHLSGEHKMKAVSTLDALLSAKDGSLLAHFAENSARSNMI